MKTFLKWLGVVAFLLALFLFVYSVENKQTYKQIAPPVTEKKVLGDTSQIGPVQYVQIGNTKVKVELALTPEAKTQGLSGRAGLGENQGMLFAFNIPGKYAFWMKDMKFSIDIIWIRDDGEVVYVKKDATPESFPQTFQPEENIKYVLEVPAGFFDKNNIKIGDKAEFIE